MGRINYLYPILFLCFIVAEWGGSNGWKSVFLTFYFYLSGLRT